MRVAKYTAWSKELIAYHIARGQAVFVIHMFTKEYNDVWGSSWVWQRNLKNIYMYKAQKNDIQKKVERGLSDSWRPILRDR